MQAAAVSVASQNVSNAGDSSSPRMQNLTGRSSCTTLAHIAMGPFTRDARSDGHLALHDENSKWRLSIGMQYVVSDRNSIPGGRSSLPTGISAFPVSHVCFAESSPVLTFLAEIPLRSTRKLFIFITKKMYL